MLFWQLFGRVAVCILILVVLGLTLSRIFGGKDE